MNIYDEGGIEQKVRDLLKSDPTGRIYVPPGSPTMLQRLADAIGVEIRVTRDCPPMTIYMLTAEDAEDAPADYIVSPAPSSAPTASTAAPLGEIGPHGRKETT
jgi:hypothetical protein